MRMGDGGWKRVAWDGNKERLVQKKSFWRKKGRLLRIARKGLCKWKAFGLWKREIFEDRKERLVQKESFRFVQNGASAFRKVFYK